MIRHPQYRIVTLAYLRPTFRSTSPAFAPGLPVAGAARYSERSTTTTTPYPDVTKATTVSIPSQRPSAIAQRLPDPGTIHAPHRFREFEVCASSGRLTLIMLRISRREGWRVFWSLSRTTTQRNCVHLSQWEWTTIAWSIKD